MDDLPLQVGQIYFICIGNTNCPNASSCQIHGNRCTQSASTDNQNLRVQELLLSFYANFF